MSGAQGVEALKVKETGNVQGLYEYLVDLDQEAFLATLYFNEDNKVTAQQVRITTSAGSLGAAQLRDDIYDAFKPMSSLGITIAATNDAIITQSVSDLISESQFQSLIFAILASMIFLIPVSYTHLRAHET